MCICVCIYIYIYIYICVCMCMREYLSITFAQVITNIELL